MPEYKLVINVISDDGNEPNVNFATPEVSVSGVMQWLTDQSHKSFIHEVKIHMHLAIEVDIM